MVHGWEIHISIISYRKNGNYFILRFFFLVTSGSFWLPHSKISLLKHCICNLQMHIHIFTGDKKKKYLVVKWSFFFVASKKVLGIQYGKRFEELKVNLNMYKM